MAFDSFLGSPLFVRRTALREGGQEGQGLASEPKGEHGEVRVLGGGFTGPTLWDLVQVHIKRRVRRILVIGAFFDESLAFLQTLQEQLDRQLSSWALTRPVLRSIRTPPPPWLASVRFVDASALTGKGG